MRHVQRTLAVGVVLVVAAAALVATSGASGATAPGARDPKSALPDVNQHFKATGPLTASAPGITDKTIKIGYITSQSGIAASSFKGGDAGAQARIALQNAQGGVDGRKLVLATADDGTNGNKTAAQDLVENQGVFGVIDLSAFTVAGAPYLQQQGVPVTGFEFDGPEWGQEPYSNMFTFAPPYYTPFDGKFYINDNIVRFLKSIGIKKLAGLAFGISQSSAQNIKSSFAAAATLGIENCYQNLSVQFGQTSFTTESLAIQQKACDGVLAAMVDASDVGLAAGLTQGGSTAKQFYYTGYDQGVVDDTNAAAALEGAYFSAAPNFTTPLPGTKGMLAALKKYGAKTTGIPPLGVWSSYQAADVMIKGLEVAGENPTRASFISELRKVSNYDGGGLFSPPVSFTGFGTVAMLPQKFCQDFAQLKNGKFVIVKKHVCGKLVSNG
jgi:branched-chain amino acid transport system substrate-binding protein